MIDSSAYQEILPRLSNGEKLIWAGKPKTGLRLQPSDALGIPFGVLFLAFSLFWEFSATKAGKAPGFFAFWGVPFILMGLYQAIGRFFWDAWLRSRQVYALTSTRLIVLRGQSLQSTSLQSLPQLNLTTYGKGLGTINFSPPSSTGNGVSYDPKNGSNFEFLEGAEEVYASILRAQKGVD